MNNAISARFQNKDDFKIFFLTVKQEGYLEDVPSIVCLMKILYWHISIVYLLLLILPGLQAKV